MKPIMPVTRRRLRRRALSLLRRWIADFRAEERGSLTLFALFMLIILLIVGGMAVDVLRYEHQRVRLQTTADRAVLAAGSLRQPLNPYDVVAEYFEKEGLLDYLEGVHVQEGLNFRVVSVQTQAVVPAFFMRLVGVNSLTAQALSTAEERYSKVEVALVLDLSNSMNSFNRIENLRIAGEEFIDTLYQNAEDGQISVSVVNYTGQVNPGAELLQYYNVTDRQPFSHCVEFGAADYQTMALSTSTQLTGAGHFDPWHTSRARNMIFCPSPRFPQWNPDDHTHRENIVLSGDPAFLRGYLAGLWADGNTSIEIGLKWGAAMLDPGSRPIIDDYIARGAVDPAFSGRPLDYDDEDSLKVVVLMTDGENFEQWIINDAFKTGQSDVWHTVFFDQVPAQVPVQGTVMDLRTEVDAILDGTMTPSAQQRHRFETLTIPMSNGQGLAPTRPNRNLGSGGNYLNNNRVYLSVRPGNSGNWYLPTPTQTNPGNSGNWRDSPWTDSSSLPASGSSSVPSATNCELHEAIDTGLAFDFYRCDDRIAYRMTYPWLWDNFPVRWVTNRLYGQPGIAHAGTMNNQILSRRPATTKNVHLNTMCDTIKGEGIPIFTVAFEAPPGGVSAMQSCASSLNHFYDVAGTDISTAFRAIAGTINRLRLTQ